MKKIGKCCAKVSIGIYVPNCNGNCCTALKTFTQPPPPIISEITFFVGRSRQWLLYDIVCVCVCTLYTVWFYSLAGSSVWSLKGPFEHGQNMYVQSYSYIVQSTRTVEFCFWTCYTYGLFDNPRECLFALQMFRNKAYGMWIVRPTIELL